MKINFLSIFYLFPGANYHNLSIIYSDFDYMPHWNWLNVLHQAVKDNDKKVEERKNERLEMLKILKGAASPPSLADDQQLEDLFNIKW